MADTGFVTTTAVTDTGSGGPVAWTEPFNAETRSDLDSAYTAGTGLSTYLHATGFGFSVPTGATIDGIEFQVREEGYGAATTFSGIWETVQALKAGSRVGTNQASGELFSAAITTTTWGGPTSLFGTTWTPADVNNSGFGFGVRTDDQASGYQVAAIYWIDAKIYYTEGGTTAVASGSATLAVIGSAAVAGVVAGVSGAAQLAAVVSSSAAGVVAGASGSPALSPVTSLAVGGPIAAAAGANALAAMTGQSAVAAKSEAAGAVPLPAMTGSAAALATIGAAGAINLPAVLGSASAAALLSGAGAIVLPGTSGASSVSPIAAGLGADILAAMAGTGTAELVIVRTASGSPAIPSPVTADGVVGLRAAGVGLGDLSPMLSQGGVDAIAGALGAALFPAVTGAGSATAQVPFGAGAADMTAMVATGVAGAVCAAQGSPSLPSVLGSAAAAVLARCTGDLVAASMIGTGTAIRPLAVNFARYTGPSFLGWQQRSFG